MGKIRIHATDDIEWTTIRALAGDTPPDVLHETELDSGITFHEWGTEDALQLMEVNYLPHAKIAVHAHDEDEIIYIVSGEMHFGNRALRAGASIFIAGASHYGYTAGPEGLRIVNFRPRADFTFHPKKTAAQAAE